MHIRIIHTPDGEAPEEIRRAWIGLDVPLANESADPVNMRAFGVLSGPKSKILATILGHLGFGGIERGYIVDAPTAFERLKECNPSAAEWWEANAPHLFKRGQPLIFNENACEVVESGV